MEGALLLLSGHDEGVGAEAKAVGLLPQTKEFSFSGFI
jgi:hypothetical protein